MTNDMRKLMEAIEKIDETKWDYPKGMKGKGASRYDIQNPGTKNRAERKAFRKAQKAKAHAERMRGQEVSEEIKGGIPGGRPFIDLSGPGGNAFAIMGNAKSYAKQLGLDGDAIVAEMQQGNYENLLNVFDSYFGDYVDLYRGDSDFEESVEVLGEDSNENREIAEQLNDIKEEIKDLIHNAQGMLRGTDASDSANAYWVPHILMALDDEHDYLGGSMTSMQDTIEELLEGDDEEEEDTSSLSSREFRDLEEDELTHGTYAITHTSEVTPDEIEVGDQYTLDDNPHHTITRKSRNHFTVTNLGSGRAWGVAYKGNEQLAKPDYFKRNTKYL